jgi:glycine dehydrogenase subunit 2
MSMNSVGRPTRPEAVNDVVDSHETLTGARGLLQDEALIFELGGWQKTGVDLPVASRARR